MQFRKFAKGAYVNTGETIFTIANPRYLWAKLDAYESDFAWLRLGQQAEFETDSYPGRTFKGKVTYLDPFFEKKTRDGSGIAHSMRVFSIFK